MKIWVIFAIAVVITLPTGNHTHPDNYTDTRHQMFKGHGAPVLHKLLQSPRKTTLFQIPFIDDSSKMVSLDSSF